MVYNGSLSGYSANKGKNPESTDETSELIRSAFDLKFSYFFILSFHCKSV